MDELKELLKENAREVDLELEKFLPKNFDDEWLDFVLGKSSFGYDDLTCTRAISEPIWDLISRGGKRWRPLLMKLAYESVGGKEDIKKFLVIPELIHNGTLMIDDIEDSSDIRRGKPCIHKLFGEDIAINAGNAMYYLPLLIIMKDESLENEVKLKIYEVVNEEMIKLSFGQGMDIYWHKGKKEEITENQYLQMCAYKTGTLARMSAKLGAILGNGEEQVNILGKFAESIGVAFQIQDDILNITNKDWGKDFGEDITEGKRSLMVIYVLNKASEEDKRDLIGILGMKTKNKVLIEEAVRIIKKYDSIDYAKNIAKELVENSWKELDLVLEESETKIKLKMFANYLIEREI
jgi:geranylgeranyl pyrophosphate synthase